MGRRTSATRLSGTQWTVSDGENADDIRHHADATWFATVVSQHQTLQSHATASEVRRQYVQILELARRMQCPTAAAHRSGRAWASVASSALLGFAGQFHGMPRLKPTNGIETLEQDRPPSPPWFPGHREGGDTDTSTALVPAATPAESLEIPL